MVPIDTIPAGQNSYTDNNPPVGVMLYYNVAALHPYGCVVTAKIKNYNFSKSNTSSIMSPIGLVNLEAPVNQIVVYPNPFSESTTVYLNLETQDNTIILAIYDVFGRLIRTSDIPDKSMRFVIPKGDLRSGVYYYEIKSGDRIFVKDKMVVF